MTAWRACHATSGCPLFLCSFLKAPCDLSFPPLVKLAHVIWHSYCLNCRFPWLNTKRVDSTNGRTCVMMKRCAKHKRKGKPFSAPYSNSNKCCPFGKKDSNLSSFAVFELFPQMFASVRSNRNHQLHFVCCSAPFQLVNYTWNLVFRFNIKHIRPPGFMNSLENTFKIILFDFFFSTHEWWVKLAGPQWPQGLHSSGGIKVTAWHVLCLCASLSVLCCCLSLWSYCP